MGGRVLEKKLRRTQKWIERCIQAYRRGKYMYAVSELESARAELESARNKLWEITAEEAKNGKVKLGYAVSMGVKSAAFALLILMIAALPTSTMRGLPLQVVKEDNLTLEWVTPDERSALVALRKSLSEMNLSASAVDETDLKVEGAQVAKVPQKDRKVQNVENSEPEKDEEGSLSVEDVLYLYEVGQRALRKESIRIK